MGTRILYPLPRISDTRDIEIIRVRITHSARWYRSGQRIKVLKETDNGFFVTIEGKKISTAHAIQLPR